MDNLTAADYRLLLSLLKFAIVEPEQRDRVHYALLLRMAMCAEPDKGPHAHARSGDPVPGMPGAVYL